jgi:UDP-glucose 4-epimerase
MRAGHDVAIIDDFSTGKREQVPEGVQVYEGSIEDGDFVLQTLQDFQPEVINHHAAQISVVVSVKEPAKDAARNVVGTVNLLEAARQTPSVRKVIYASSGGAMYGNPATLPCDEETPPNPTSPYGLSKYVAERYVWLYTTLAPFKATVFRYCNVYGPRQDPHGEAGVCAIFAKNMLENKPVTIFGDGTKVRDYVYVEDLARANVLALDKGDGGYYNLASGIGTSTNQVFETLCDATGYAREPIRGEDRPGEVEAIVLSAAKAGRELGWQPATDFATGIQKTVAWYRSL